ncbi:Werner syndrome ATP-dependent helicase homolog isoform X2 [Megalops cyprinoides]|nr:Werner syndrome ATP-dependent helicase homolog isoform X2 [Megalops cyprinoides]XP_036385651.1 Werner syndrome ATP-dependent helicase homolog isoform X2 [Megalops cyprinoides]
MSDRTLPSWMSVHSSNEKNAQKQDQPGLYKKNILEHDLPYLEFSGTVVYSREKNDCSFLSADLRSSLLPGSAVGFDIEWPPSFIKGKKKKVAVVQLCASEEKCYLFHLSSMLAFPPGLKMLLEDEAIKKVGVGIEGDMWKLLSDFDIKMKNFVELTDLANEKLRCVEKWSLDGLVKHLFKKQLMKDKNVRCSQWDDFDLTEDQKRYAATDAYAGLLIHKKLESIHPVPQRIIALKEKLIQMASEMKDLADHIPEGVHSKEPTTNSADQTIEDMAAKLRCLRDLLLEDSSKAYGVKEESDQEVVVKKERISDEQMMSSHKLEETTVFKRELPLNQDLNHSSTDLLKAPQNVSGPVEEDSERNCNNIHRECIMSLDISEYELQMLEMQARQEDLEEQSTLEFQDRKALNDSSDQSYVVESDEELESAMLQCAEEVERKIQKGKVLQSDREKTYQAQSAVPENEYDDEDEGIEEEEEEFDPSIPEPSCEEIKCLKMYFGHSSFKPVQWKVIYSVVKERRDNLVVMATGYGKSLCFQFPPVYSGGVSVVISPLISLMEDQVLQLKMSNIPACFLGSAQTQNILPDLQMGHYRVVYMTPEFCSGSIWLLEQLNSNIGLTLIAIDEAHCISEWGHDFRGAYRSLGNLKTKLPEVPILALTATASPSIRDDIVQSLRLLQPMITCTTFDRPNLFLEVLRKSGDITQDLRSFLVKKSMGDYEFEGPAIVYCPSRKEAERVSSALSKLGILCGVYHAGLNIKVRRETQHRFMRDEIQCMVATVAFGMGINKADIRKVIHYGAPKEMESYYQEIGRAGRDGLPSACHVLWASGDMALNRFLLNQVKSNKFRGYKMKMMAKMEQYLSSPKCRRKLILSHFEDKQLRRVTSGIMGTSRCCDNCRSRGMGTYTMPDKEPKLRDFGKEAYQLMSAIRALDGRFGLSVPILFLRGSDSQRLPDKYRCHPLFGAGRGVSETWWKALGHQLLMEEHLKESNGHRRFSTLCKLTPKAKKWLSKASDETKRSLFLQPSSNILVTRISVPTRSHTSLPPVPGPPESQSTASVQEQLSKYSRQETSKSSKSADLSSARPRPGSSPKSPAAKAPSPVLSAREQELQAELYGRLVAGRQKLASEKDIPPAILATNKILLDMAKMRPCTLASLKLVDGVSEAKSSMLAPLLAAISDFCQTHGLQVNVSAGSAAQCSANPKPVERAVFSSLSDSAAITYRLFQEEAKSLKLVSDSRSLPLAVVESHLLQALRSGLPLDTERAGLTPTVRSGITRVISSHHLNSDLSNIKAIRAMVPSDISTFLIQLTVLELEKEGVSQNNPMNPPQQQPNPPKPAEVTPMELAWIEPEVKPPRRGPRPALPVKVQTSPDSNEIDMNEDELFSEISMPTGLKASAAPCSSEPVTAPKTMSSTGGIELASWNQVALDEDTQELFSDSPPQNVSHSAKRKLPAFDELPKSSASTSTGSKKAKKKGLFK